MFKSFVNISHVRRDALFSKSNDAEKVSRLNTGGKIGFTGSVLLIGILIVTVLVGIMLYLHKPQTNSLASFTCLSSRDERFTIALEVNLTDGMNQDEAIRVATEVFKKVSKMNAKEAPSIFRSGAFMREDETWTVWFEYVEEIFTVPVHQTPFKYSQLIFGHFEVAINPFDHTIMYHFQKHTD